MGTVRIITVTFLEDDVFEGDIPREAFENADEAEFDCDTVEDAVHQITARGLTFAATGTDWAAHPDGTQIVDYATAEREEVTAHLHGFTDADTAAIIAAVG
jgi:hypothetical protein